MYLQPANNLIFASQYFNYGMNVMEQENSAKIRRTNIFFMSLCLVALYISYGVFVHYSMPDSEAQNI